VSKLCYRLRALARVLTGVSAPVFGHTPVIPDYPPPPADAHPPPPPEWATPDLSRPPPPAWACQLHPLLTHAAHGAALHFDLRHAPDSALVAVPAVFGVQHRRITADELAQPATWPARAELPVARVADDAPALPPLAAHNPEGVRVGDVLAALYAAARTHVRPGEYTALGPKRREQVKLSYWARCAAPPAEDGAEDAEAASPPPQEERPGPDDGCRRIDVLGTNVVFRGLEPAPAGGDAASQAAAGAWVVFLGPP
jgi:hypothetical protein